MFDLRCSSVWRMQVSKPCLESESTLVTSAIHRPEWTAHLKWSARILRLVGESISDKELEGELEREEHEQREKRAQRPPGRREVPEFRKRPDAFLTTEDDDPVLYEPTLSIRVQN